MSCRFCSVPLENPRAKVCSDLACRRAYKAEWMRGQKRKQKTESWTPRACQGCGTPVPIERRSDATHCSRACIEKRRSAQGERLAYYAEIKDLKNERQRQYRQKNPARTRGYKEKRRRNSVGVVTEKDWASVLRQYRGCCAYCGVDGVMTMDHVIPLSRGGRHTVGNVVPACGPCNGSKFNKFLAEWQVFRLRRAHALEA